LLFSVAFELLGELMPGEEGHAAFLLKKVVFGSIGQSLLRDHHKGVLPLSAIEWVQLRDCYQVLLSCALSFAGMLANLVCCACLERCASCLSREK
jgi:hypothetical protein